MSIGVSLGPSVKVEGPKVTNSQPTATASRASSGVRLWVSQRVRVPNI